MEMPYLSFTLAGWPPQALETEGLGAHLRHSPALPQILLWCRWEGRAYVEHGGEECSLTLRAEADRSAGCPKVR